MPNTAADKTAQCPFCRPQIGSKTPRLHPDLTPAGRLSQGDSLLFPNLFPYGSYSAVSLFNDQHFVEIGTASYASCADSFLNLATTLFLIIMRDGQRPAGGRDENSP